MANTNLVTYVNDVAGKGGNKLTFANWISILSPTETPFSSMISKGKTDTKAFSWQTDVLATAGANAQIESYEASAITGSNANNTTTTEVTNVTQILSKIVSVSDSVEATAHYGRGGELEYKMGKAGKEITRDLEWAFLNNSAKVAGNATTARLTAGYQGLVAPQGSADPDTGAVVNIKTGTANKVTEKQLFDVTSALYVAGANANVIMFNPAQAGFFSSLQEATAPASRQRIFENSSKFSVYVATVVDPLGQEFKLIPNRLMPAGEIFIFNPSDFSEMVLRPAKRIPLAKTGSTTKYLIEMETGLQSRNPYCCGQITLKV